MKTIKFTPLRKVKTLNKIVVASYMQWRKVITADYSNFNLILGTEHSKMNGSDLVYNYKGKQLFFYDFNPYDIPVYASTPMLNDKIVSAYIESKDFPLKFPYGIYRNDDSHTTYNSRGMDCDGVPAFSHYTADYIATHHSTSIEDFTPLTVDIVLKWYGWFLWQLNNSKLISK